MALTVPHQEQVHIFTLVGRTGAEPTEHGVDTGGVPDFDAACRAALARAGAHVDRAPTVGAWNAVYVDDSTDVVHRFPLRNPHRLGEIAERHRRARHLGLPVPEVLAVHRGGLGSAFMTMRRMPGLPLPEAPARSARVADRTVADVRDLLAELRRVTRTDWPFPSAEWRSLWADLARAGIGTAHAHSSAAAAACAAVCPVGLVHGDLAGHNILVAESGAITAVLDWDHAVIGDTCMDSAALLYGMPADLRTRLLTEDTEVAAEQERFRIYRGTWEFQHELWADADGPGHPIRPHLPGGTGH